MADFIILMIDKTITLLTDEIVRTKICLLIRLYDRVMKT
jgi:hypothetical protein